MRIKLVHICNTDRHKVIASKMMVRPSYILTYDKKHARMLADVNSMWWKYGFLNRINPQLPHFCNQSGRN